MNRAFGRKEMIDFIDVFVLPQKEFANNLIGNLRQFAERSENWSFLEEESKRYAQYAGEHSCGILQCGNPCYPAVAITEKKEGIYYIANIVPRDKDLIGVREYNAIARAFANDLRKYCKEEGLSINVRTTKEEVQLQDIIPGVKCRSLFERYLSLHPLSYHPLDIERLDIFICYLARFSKKRLDVDLLRGWLIEHKQWSRQDAEWCVSRIKIGLDILNVKRKLG